MLRALVVRSVSFIRPWLWLLTATLLMALTTSLVMAQTPGSTGGQPSSESAGSGGEGSYAALVELLKDPVQRERLIAELEQLSADGESNGNDSTAGDGAEISGITDGPASGLVRLVSRTMGEMAGAIQRLVVDGWLVDWPVVGALAWRLMAVLALAYLVLVLGQRLLEPLWQRLERHLQSVTERHRLFHVSMAALVSLALGAGLLAVAFVVAQAIVWWLADGDRYTAEVLGLALQAFIVVEAARLLIKVVFAPRSPGMRLFPLSEENSRYWSRWLSRATWLIGYVGIMLVPAIQGGGHLDLASAIGWAAALLALAYTWNRLWVARPMVRSGLVACADRAARAERALTAWTWQLLAISWHWLALIYALGVFVVAIIRPGESLPFVALATLKTAVIVGGSIFVAAMLSGWISRGVSMPEGLMARLPTLQLRLNAYVPLILRILRGVIALVALAGIFWVWGLVNVFAWFTSEGGRWLLAATFDILIVLLIALTVWLVATGLIEAKLNSVTEMPSARMKTLLTLFRNAIAIALIIIVAMIVLSELGVDIGPLLAGAGVLGLAIGFGAQKMVQDMITGVFIQIENAIHTGDVISAAGVTGTVERLSIRSVSVRDLSGTLHVVPFSSVDIVSNYTRDYAYHQADYHIGYRENIDDAVVQLKAAFDELTNDPEHKESILQPIEIPGVTALGESSVAIRARIKTAAGSQWRVGRAYNRLVKMYFDQAGIEIPFPHTTLYFGADKDGTAPPVNLRLLDAGRDRQTGRTDGDGIEQPET